MLYDLFLPFVNNYKHLGNILQSDNSMTKNRDKNTNNFYFKDLFLFNKEFFFYNPDVILKLYTNYF